MYKRQVQVAEKAIQEGNCPAEALPELKPVFAAIHTQYPDIDKTNVGVGSTIFAVKPGDGSAREQAASCQKVLGGWANIANEYATKRYQMCIRDSSKAGNAGRRSGKAFFRHDLEE